MPTVEISFTLDRDYTAEISYNRYREWGLEDLWTVVGTHRGHNLIEKISPDDPIWDQAIKKIESDLITDLYDLMDEPEDRERG